MIFISGVHGVGKTYFSNLVKSELHINSYTASELIEKSRNLKFNENKQVSDIQGNQTYLIHAIKMLQQTKEEFLLDGHFCLLDEKRAIKRISFKTFVDLRPNAIILLTENPDIIAQRRKERDGAQVSVQEIKLFQKEEITYARQVASQLSIRLFVSNGKNDLLKAIDFIKFLLREGD